MELGHSNEINIRHLPGSSSMGRVIPDTASWKIDQLFIWNGLTVSLKVTAQVGFDRTRIPRIDADFHGFFSLNP